MSTDAVELMDFINPDLTWKSVAKGSRSTARRTRKLVAKSAMTDVEAAEKSTSEVETQGVSESEKLGVTVLSRHFVGKVEHVPIKKRRFMFHSPSPPPSEKSSSPCHNVPEQLVQINHASQVSKLTTGVLDGKTLEASSEKCSRNGHDFFGIEILADVACNSHMGDGILPAVESRLVEESVQQQNSLSVSVPVEGISSSARSIVATQNETVNEDEKETVASQNHAVAVSDKPYADECDGEAAQRETESIDAQNNSVAVLDNSLSDEHNRMAVEAETEKIAPQNNSFAVADKSSDDELDMNAGDAETKSIASENNSVTVLDKSSADECDGEENTAYSRDDRLHWDLNLSVDVWEQPCDFGDDVSQRNVAGEVSEDIHTQKQCSGNNNDHVDGAVASDGHGNISTSSEFNSHTNGHYAKGFQSGYDSQIEDGELREPYPCWEENDGDAGEIEHVDYDSEPEEDKCYSLSETDEKKMDNVDKGIVSGSGYRPRKSESYPSDDVSRMRMSEPNDVNDVEKHVVVCINDSHVKDSSMGFVSKAFKRELPSHVATQRRRSNRCDDYYDRVVGLDKFMGKDRSGFDACGTSPGRGHFGYWHSSKRRHSPVYNNGSYNFGRPRPKSVVEGRGCMNGSDHTVSGTDGHIRRQFSNGSCRSRFRRYPEGLNRDFRGIDGSMPSDSNEYLGARLQRRMANRRERSNSPVFRRLHYPQTFRKSRSRSGSRSPIAWNNRNRSPNFRMDDRKERVSLPFQKRFPADYDTSFMSPPRNRRSPVCNYRWFEDGSNNSGGDNNNNNNNNSFRGRKSRVSIFHTSQRFDSGQSMRRINSVNEFRPMMHSRRFPNGAGGGDNDRGCKYEGNDEDKKGNRYEMIQRGRRYDKNNIDGDGTHPAA